MACKFQFSLRWMFVAVAVVAVIAAEAVAFPLRFALILGLLITSFLVPALAAGIIYSRRSARAFCIGALAWLLAARWLFNMSFGAPVGIVPEGDFAPAFFLQTLFSSANIDFWAGSTTRYDHCILWSLTIVSGFMVVLIRWLTLGKSSGEGE